MNPLTSLLPLLLGALLVTALSIPPIKRLAWRLDLVDDPKTGEHKSHQRPTPYGGGLAIFLGALLALVAATWLFQPLSDAYGTIAPAFAGATALLAVGLLDDWRGLPTLPRFLIQLAVTAVLVAGWPEFRLALFADAPLLIAPLAALWIAAMTNAFNFLDNMDGLSAGVAGIALLLLGGMGLASGHLPGAVLSLVLAGAVAGFLFYNFPPATLFMGDAGGLFLGFLASGASVLLSNHFVQVHPALDFAHRCAPLLPLTVPLYDFLTVNIIRLRNGAPPWIGDNNHISHRLVRLGLSRRNAVLVIYAATLLTGLPGLLLVCFPSWNGWALLAAVCLAVLTVAILDFSAFKRRRPA